MDIMNDMLTKGIAPTATAVKQTIERLHTLGSISGRLADPKAVIAYLREGGRQVPFFCTALPACCPQHRAVWAECLDSVLPC